MLCGALKETNRLRGAVVIFVVVRGASASWTRRMVIVVGVMIAS
jgi:hypothetical protein